jgi:hypothetical protein
MKEPIPNNNEFEAAESALRKIGSNLWFSGLSEEWQDFLTSNTVEHFDTYELTMEQAAASLVKVYQELVTANPGILEQNPWHVVFGNE